MKKNLFYVVLMTCFFHVTESFAFIPPPPMPPSPTFAPLEDANETINAVEEKVKTYSDQAKTYKDELLNKVKSYGNLIGLNFSESALKKEEGEPNLAAAREIKESEHWDIRNEESVAEAFQTLFLMYPNDVINSVAVDHREGVKKQYRDKAIEFSNDNMIELYISVRDLEKERLDVLKKEIDALSACFVKGEENGEPVCSNASDTEEQLGPYVNGYKLREIYDSYVRLYEELMAMRAQYETGRALREGVEPFNADQSIDESIKETQETSANDVHYVYVEKSGFAQVWAKEDTDSQKQIQQDKSQKEATEQDQEETSKKKILPLSVVKAEPYKVDAPFAGAEKNFKALAGINAAYDILSEAQRLHNVKQQLPGLRRPFIEYTKMQLLHDKAISALTQSEKNIGGYTRVVDGQEKTDEGYLSSYYDKATAADVWFGDTCRLKVIPKTKKCSKVFGCKSPKDYDSTGLIKIVCSDGSLNVTDYAKRRGLSGYAISAYKLAKADQVLELNADSFGTPVMDFDQEADVSSVDKSKDDPNKFKDKDEMVSSNNEEYAKETIRQQNILRWQIGSEISNVLGSDMDSSSPVYGYATKKYPIWTDEKRFYDQYLQEKYKNMVAYFNSPLLTSTVFELASKINENMKVDPNTLNAEKQTIYANALLSSSQKENAVQELIEKMNEKLARLKQEDGTSILQASEAFKEENHSNMNGSPILKLKTDQDQKMLELVENFEKNLESLNNQKQKLYDDIDDQMELLNNAKKEYNDLKGQKKEAEAALEGQSMAIEASEKRAKESPTYVTGLKKNAESKKAEYIEEADRAAKKADTALENVEDYQEELANLKLKVKAVDKEIANLKKEYIASAVKMEAEHIAKIKEALEQKNLLVSHFDIKKLGAINPVMNFVFNAAIQAVQDFRTAAVSYVNDAYQQILNLKENIYDPTGYEKINNIHRNMLQNIENINVSFEGGVVGGILIDPSGLGNLGDLIYKIIFTSNCDELGCENEDSQYFVSLDAKVRDFVAPKRIAPERLAPLREAFHFDAVDYDHILKTDAERVFTPYPEIKRPQTTRVEFLKLKQKMPEVWKRILMPNGFVEKDVDIEKILQNEEEKNESSVSALGVIQIIPVKTSAQKFLEAKGEHPASVNSSELSIFLEYDNGLTLTDGIYQLAKYFEDLDDSAKDYDEDEVKEKEKMLLERDQIGDYLKFVDLEQMYQTTLAQLKVKVDEARQKVLDAISRIECTYPKKGTGYVMDGDTTLVSSEFIADDETYEAISKCLNDGKEKLIKEATALLSKLPPLNEALIDRKEKLDHMLKTMQKDSEELVSLSDNMVPDASFDQKIKSARTDGSVTGKYDEEGMSEFEKNLEKFEVPYRAKYF